MVSSEGKPDRSVEQRGVSLERALARIGSLRSAPSRYTIGEEISRDDLGVCVRVWDDTLQREVAMKLLHDLPPGRSSSTPETITRHFIEEAWIAGQLNHPGIVPIHEAGI